MNIIKRINFKKVAVGLLVIFVAMQFIRIDKTPPPTDLAKDFIAINKPTASLANIIKTSCYDCHSNESTYPWYSNVAPVSWWLKDHINEGRGELNFSEWGGYSSKKQDHKLEEAQELVEEGEMPLWSYTIVHQDAKISTEQQVALAAYFKSLRTYESKKN